MVLEITKSNPPFPPLEKVEPKFEKGYAHMKL